MECLVEIWALDEKTPRGAEVVTKYLVDAPNLLAARIAGWNRFQQEWPDHKGEIIVYGREAPKGG